LDRIRILGANLKPVKIGDIASAITSYEITLSSVRGVQNQLANLDGSCGFSWENATDCHSYDLYSVGYRTGYKTLSGCSAIDMLMCHGWIRPVHGVFQRGFDIGSRRCSIIGAYADTPSNYGDTSITDLAAYYISGLNNTIQGRAFMTINGANGALATDGLVSIVKTSQEVYSSTKILVGGSDATHRWKTRTEGSTRTLDADFHDQGEFYSANQSHNATFSGALRPQVTTISGLPGSVMRENSLVMITDPAANKGRLVYHDGTIWRYVSDDSAV
jgi:hypothetical protein